MPPSRVAWLRRRRDANLLRLTPCQARCIQRFHRRLVLLQQVKASADTMKLIRRFPFVAWSGATPNDAPAWESDIQDSDLIDEQKADFLLAQAKEQLNATVADAAALTTTGIYLLGGLLTVTTALAGVTASRFNTAAAFHAQNWSEIVPLLVTTIYLACDALMIMWSALSIKGLDHAGNTPSNLASSEMFSRELRLIKFAEATSYQTRIDRNHRRNEKVGRRINLGIKLLCIAPLLFLAAVALSVILSP